MLPWQVLPEEQLSTLARALVLAGGVILVVAGMIAFVGGNVSSYVSSPLSGLNRSQEGVLAIVAGVLALSSYRQLRMTGWSVLMIVLGIITGGLGGILILVSGLVSLVVAHAEKTVKLER